MIILISLINQNEQSDDIENIGYDDHHTLIGLITRANLVDIVYDSIWGEDNETSHSSKTYSNEVERENERQNETQQRLTSQGTQRYHEDIMNGTDREHTHNTDDTGVDR